MRSTIIVAAFALAVFTAPVPEADPIYKGNGRSIERRFNAESELDFRAIRNEGQYHGAKPKGPRYAEEVDVEARAIRNKGDRRDVEARAIRNKSDRRDVEELDVEARAIRNKGDRREVKKESRSPEPEPTMHGGKVGGSPGNRNNRRHNERSSSRDATPNPVYRITKGGSPFLARGDSTENSVTDISESTEHNVHEREAEAEPITRTGHGTRK